MVWNFLVTSAYVCVCVCIYQCREKLVSRQRLQSEDYRVHHDIAVKCHHDIDKYDCRSLLNPQQQHHAGMSAVLDCLANVTRLGRLLHGIDYICN